MTRSAPHFQPAFRFAEDGKPTHRPARRAITVSDVFATTYAQAILHVREVRRVETSTEGWLVRDTADSYNHRIVLRRIGWSGTAADFEAICLECPARRAHPCWAVAKVEKSKSYRTMIKDITTKEKP